MKVITLVTTRSGQAPDFTIQPAGTALALSDTEARYWIQQGLAKALDSSEPNLCHQHQETDASTCHDENVNVDDMSLEANELQMALLDAMDDLPPEALGREGKPTVKALEAILEKNISAAERDQAWKTYQGMMGKN